MYCARLRCDRARSRNARRMRQMHAIRTLAPPDRAVATSRWRDLLRSARSGLPETPVNSPNVKTDDGSPILVDGLYPRLFGHFCPARDFALQVSASGLGGAPQRPVSEVPVKRE